MTPDNLIHVHAVYPITKATTFVAQWSGPWAGFGVTTDPKLEGMAFYVTPQTPVWMWSSNRHLWQFGQHGGKSGATALPNRVKFTVDPASGLVEFGVGTSALSRLYMNAGTLGPFYLVGRANSSSTVTVTKSV